MLFRSPTDIEKTEILGMTLDIAFEEYAKDDEHLEKLINTFREYSKNNAATMLKSYKNAANVIQYLRDKGYLVGIVTSKSRKVVLENLVQTNMEELFDCIVTSDDTTVHKPNAEPLLLALEQLNVSTNEAIYIGDHENDIIAGNNANMKTGLMKYSLRLEQALNNNPTYVFDDLDKIKEKF